VVDIPRDYWLYLAVIVLAGFSFLPVKLYIRFYRAPNEIAVNSHLTVWFIPYRLNIINPMTKAFWNLSANRPWERKPPQDLAAKEIRWFRLFSRINRMQKISRRVWTGTNRFFKRISKPVKIQELNLYTEIALGDAVQTALSTGAIWAMQGFLYTRLAGIFNTTYSHNNLMVIPNFQRSNFLLIDYSCIFQFRLGHIIIIIYQMFRNAGEIYSLIRRVSK